MTTEVAVVGAPFLDFTFAGLPRVPQIGEELLASALHIGPGGSGMQAIGAARLGLQTTLVAPLGSSDGARVLRAALESEGVAIVPPDGVSNAIPTTALLATPDGVAMATVVGGNDPTPEDVAGATARATVLSMGRLPLAPPDTKVYAVTGTLELNNTDDATLSRLQTAHVLILNASEAMALTGSADPEDAARALTRHVPTVVVTLGAEGALAVDGECMEHAPAPPVEVVDATGAGDLFAAAYVWADLRGAGLADRIAWASLYAGLSVRTPTALSGALRVDEILAEGEARGLTRPPAA